MPDPGFGIYIHWPFCQSKCPYCDFNSHVWAKIDQKRWAEAYVKEIRRCGRETPDRVLRSVFFGGGTPSLMDISTVDTILNEIARHWRFENDVEITLEANPTSVEMERFQGYRMAGVNRVSLGVQALNDTDLRMLGRLHSVEEALRGLDIARSTFERVNFDLIYARQGQSLTDWQAELQRALSFTPSHMSLYQLTIEPGTAFGDRFDRGKLPGLPDDDLGADLWDLTQTLTGEAGLPGYEVSNHAKPGQESRHNLIYWQGGDYIGIGPGAHGRLTTNAGRMATETVKAPGAWIAAVDAGDGSQEQQETLSDREQLDEKLMMGLRLHDGVMINDREYDKLSNNIKELEHSGLLRHRDHHLRLTEQGRPLLNAVLRELLRD